MLCQRRTVGFACNTNICYEIYSLNVSLFSKAVQEVTRLSRQLGSIRLDNACRTRVFMSAALYFKIVEGALYYCSSRDPVIYRRPTIPPNKVEIRVMKISLSIFVCHLLNT